MRVSIKSSSYECSISLCNPLVKKQNSSRLLLSIEKIGVQGISIVDLPQDPRPLLLSEVVAIGLFSLQHFGGIPGVANLDVGL